MAFIDEVKERIEENKDQLIELLSEQIKINSVQTKAYKAKDGSIYPFGKGVQEAFEHMLEYGKDNGFETFNADNYGGHLEWGGKILDENGLIKETNDQCLGILGHLDVVPVGDESQWKYGPFSAHIDEDNFIHGRGTQDDKGPLVACLFALKTMKDMGYMPAKKIRLIIGLDEEQGWSGMNYYKKQVKMPDFGFTPDSAFPVVNGEKGIATFDLVKKFEKAPAGGVVLKSVEGGMASNMVAGHCRALITADDKLVYDHIREMVKNYELGGESYGRPWSIKAKGVGKSLEITTSGLEVHGARPWEGMNAITIMMDFLKNINFANESANEAIDFYNKYIGFKVYGENMDCAYEDEHSKLTWNVGLCKFDEEAASFTCNVRVPVSLKLNQFYEMISDVIDKGGMGIVKSEGSEPFYYSPEHPLIKALLETYVANGGSPEDQAIVAGGVSYAKAMDNAVAYGALFPEDGDYMHQVDERASVDRLVQITKLYAEAIYKLSSTQDIFWE
ncbi:MAG: dipeptidase PepV [Clostridia bacterium]|nr:dipeptidase PepV [Clostridia bacterium]